jgi:hypothetical protein
MSADKDAARLIEQRELDEARIAQIAGAAAASLLKEALPALTQATKPKETVDADEMHRLRARGDVLNAVQADADSGPKTKFFLALIRGPASLPFESTEKRPALSVSLHHFASFGPVTCQSYTQRVVRADESDGPWARLSQDRQHGCFAELSDLAICRLFDAASRMVVSYTMTILGDPENPWRQRPSWSATGRLLKVTSLDARGGDTAPISRFVIALPVSRMTEEQLASVGGTLWSESSEERVYEGLPRLSDLLEDAGLPIVKRPGDPGCFFGSSEWTETATTAYIEGRLPDAPNLDSFSRLLAWVHGEDAAEKKPRKRGRRRKAEVA